MTSLPNLYLITDRQQIAADRDFLSVIEELLQAGVRMLQMREKDLPAAELFPLATQLRALTAAHDCRLLINDRVDVAQAVAADGVHLGGHSLPTAAVRKLLGPDKLIGVSTHSPEEIQLAAEQGADFVTFGPVFFTPSKAAYGNPVGLEKLTQCCATSSIPVYALGGISANNAAAVINSGANGIALISALLAADLPASAFHSLLKTIKS